LKVCVGNSSDAREAANDGENERHRRHKRALLLSDYENKAFTTDGEEMDRDQPH
jgi:hypothetical protein